MSSKDKDFEYARAILERVRKKGPPPMPIITAENQIMLDKRTKHYIKKGIPRELAAKTALYELCFLGLDKLITLTN